MATIQLPREWKEFLRLLNSNEVRYLLVGGVAVAYHGYPRTTGDIDLWVDSGQGNAQAVEKALREFGLDLPDDFQAGFNAGRKVFRIGHPPLRIEVLTEISGVDFDPCYRRRHTVLHEDLAVPIIGLDDLKQNKRASGRTNDLDDLAHLP